MSNTAFNSNYIGVSGLRNDTQNFRLTLTSNTPVMTSEVLAATTLYLTPYTGNRIALYNGSSWDLLISSQVSISLSTISADTNYDVFAYNNSGTVTLELLAWTSSGAGTSARATSLAYQDGILVKSGTATRRYIGTIRGSASGQSQFSFGGLANGGTEAKLYVWNYNNRVLHTARSGDTTDSWAYSTSGAWRAANGSNTARISFVCGLTEDRVQSSYSVYCVTNAGNVSCGIGVGLNSTTVFSGSTAHNNASPVNLQARYDGIIPIGFNYLQALEILGNPGTVIFFGDAGTSLYQISSLQFSFMM